MRPLRIEGAFEFSLQRHHDDRGAFVEWFHGPSFESVVGPLNLAQANCSVSRRGVVRGVHFTDVPPGQAKYVTCLAGRVLDVVVDVRVGSPTFGQWDAVELGGDSCRAVYMAEGLGHAFAALDEQSTVVYLCTAVYVAGRERAIDPLDPELGLPWSQDLPPVLSPRDLAAPSLHEALEHGWLPPYPPQSAPILRGAKTGSTALHVGGGGMVGRASGYGPEGEHVGHQAWRGGD